MNRTFLEETLRLGIFLGVVTMATLGMLGAIVGLYHLVIFLAVLLHWTSDGGYAAVVFILAGLLTVSCAVAQKLLPKASR